MTSAVPTCSTPGPLKRYGGKGKTAHRLVPHFARAAMYAESCLGGGAVFFTVPEGAYGRAAVNDLDRSLVTFFEVLRERSSELQRVLEATPYARQEFIRCLEPSDDPLEEARRVFVRSTQGFGGKATCAGDWGRNPGWERLQDKWCPQVAVGLADRLQEFARRLRAVSIDCTDAADFVARWGRPGTFIYSDLPYLPETRKGGADYLHEMTADDHRRMAVAHLAAVERGARVAVSGYPSALYDELYAGWRRVASEVNLLGTRNANGQKRTEVLWCSYPANEELGYREEHQSSLFG